MSKPYPVGVSDFRTLRDDGYEYVDKSELLVELLGRTRAQVILFPRPRRFGKTLNLSMLRYFFERSDEDLSYLFEDLNIWSAGEEYRAHFQRYPVIYMSFREVKKTTYDDCFKQIKSILRDIFTYHRALLDGGHLDEFEAHDFQEILAGTAAPDHYERALERLSTYLHRATGERVVILIDEYDAPIHAGYINGYGREELDFFRTFLTLGLKDNRHLKRGVITGILRIARESIFSGLNNIAVYTLLDATFNTAFGFTEAEVERLLHDAGLDSQIDQVRQWYNGYSFGGTVVYNPWSVLNFLERRGVAEEYWLNTSSNELIVAALRKHGPRLQPELETLLTGGSVDVQLETNVILDEIDRRSAALWSLLVFAGYLRAEALPRVDARPATYRVSIPNLEVRQVYATSFREWLELRTSSQGADTRRLLDALLSGDAETLEIQRSPRNEPERVIPPHPGQRISHA
ncbi:MAG: AAA family ATPase [Deltaproteobacteria bacterium]|nr:AAA family ATPase [Deltaproteobacteria bacterium]